MCRSSAPPRLGFGMRDFRKNALIGSIGETERNSLKRFPLRLNTPTQG